MATLPTLPKVIQLPTHKDGVQILEWKKVPNYVHYWFCERGFAYSTYGKGRFLKTGKDNDGYDHFRLYKDGKGYSFSTNQLTALVDFVHLTAEQRTVDHADGDKNNNHVSNLRPASCSEQVWHRKIMKNNKSGYRGVSWYKRNNKWVATIQYRYKQYHLGYFDDPKDASLVYEYWRTCLHTPEWMIN